MAPDLVPEILNSVDVNSVDVIMTVGEETGAMNTKAVEGSRYIQHVIAVPIVGTDDAVSGGSPFRPMIGIRMAAEASGMILV